MVVEILDLAAIQFDEGFVFEFLAGLGQSDFGHHTGGNIGPHTVSGYSLF